MAENLITLDFLAAQQQRILKKWVDAFRDERHPRRHAAHERRYRRLAAMAQRQDRATKTLLELDLLTDQQNRFGDRLRRLEAMQER